MQIDNKWMHMMPYSADWCRTTVGSSSPFGSPFAEPRRVCMYDWICGGAGKDNESDSGCTFNDVHACFVVGGNGSRFLIRLQENNSFSRFLRGYLVSYHFKATRAAVRDNSRRDL